MATTQYDVVIVGGGPAGLAAGLVLGRARKRVLLLDAGVPRNAAATEIHGFVTRDGTPPAEFRRIGREQLAPYPSVEVRQEHALAIDGESDAFSVTLAAQVVTTRRVLLCTGMVDQLLDLPGYRELWGKAIFQCPYCHGWEVRDQAMGYLAPGPEMASWALLLCAWSSDVVVFTDGRFAMPEADRARLDAAGIRIEARPVARLIAEGEHLAAVELADGARVARSVLFSHPPQQQVPLVAGLGLAAGQGGRVQVGMTLETSRPGIYAAGDLSSMMQSALSGASAGAMAAAMINHQLTTGLGVGH